MQRKQHLFIPGPTPVPPEVAAAMCYGLVVVIEVVTMLLCNDI